VHNWVKTERFHSILNIALSAARRCGKCEKLKDFSPKRATLMCKVRALAGVSHQGARGRLVMHLTKTIYCMFVLNMC
jgi:hypothetical protein